MRIIRLQAENIKRLVAIEIAPTGNLVRITGKNRNGKTSVLDSIWWCLGGAKHIQDAPIRKGATSARIRLDLGEIVATRTFARKGDAEYTTELRVESADGARFPSPQKILDDLIGELSFDPGAFLSAAPKDQLETLRQFVPGVDFAAMEQANTKDYDRRRDLNREIKRLRAEAGPVLPQPPPPVDEAALLEQLREAGETNTQIGRRRNNRESLERETQGNRQRATQLREQAEQLIVQAQALDATALAAEEKLLAAGPLPDLVDCDVLQQAITEAREHNQQAERCERYFSRTGEADLKESEAEMLTVNIEQRKADIAQKVREAKLPVDGIELGEECVLFDGLPLDQASDAQQLQISVAIAAALNPELRVIRVRNGNDLDEDSEALLEQFADEHDLQIWMEVVDSSGKVGFVISDGQLASNEEAA